MSNGRATLIKDPSDKRERVIQMIKSGRRTQDSDRKKRWDSKKLLNVIKRGTKDLSKTTGSSGYSKIVALRSMRVEEPTKETESSKNFNNTLNLSRSCLAGSPKKSARKRKKITESGGNGDPLMQLMEKEKEEGSGRPTWMNRTRRLRTFNENNRLSGFGRASDKEKSIYDLWEMLNVEKIKKRRFQRIKEEAEGTGGFRTSKNLINKPGGDL